MTIGSHEDIVCFDIAVNDVVHMEVAESVDHFTDDIADDWFGEFPIVFLHVKEEITQGAPFAILDRKIFIDYYYYYCILSE